MTNAIKEPNCISVALVKLNCYNYKIKKYLLTIFQFVFDFCFLFFFVFSPPDTPIVAADTAEVD